MKILSTVYKQTTHPKLLYMSTWGEKGKETDPSPFLFKNSLSDFVEVSPSMQRNLQQDSPAHHIASNICITMVSLPSHASPISESVGKESPTRPLLARIL